MPTEQPCEGVRFAVDTTTAVQALTTRSNPAHLSSSDSQPGPPVREGELGFVAGLPWEHFPLEQWTGAGWGPNLDGQGSGGW